MVKNDIKKLKSLDRDIHQNLINSSWSHTQHVNQVSSESVHNFLGYRATYRFWPNPSMMKNHFRNSSGRIWMFTKIESIRPCRTPNLPTKLHRNPSTTFWDILHTNKQADRQTDRQAVAAPMVGSECPGSSGVKRAASLYVGELCA